MPATPSEAEVLIVVATLGQRPEFLRQTLASIRSQEVVSDIVIVAPLANESVQQTAREFEARLLPDPGSLPGAINLVLKCNARSMSLCV